MRAGTKIAAAMLIVAGSLTTAACGNKQSAAGDTAPATVSTAVVDTPATHHSALKGALVGAAAGHVLGHHAIAGAAVGALVQHERNKRH